MASSIKIKFYNLINDFETVIKNLNFIMILVSDEQHRIDQQFLDSEIATVTTIIKEVVEIYSNVVHNKRTYRALTERVIIAGDYIVTLVRRKQENKIIFHSQDYYNAFVKLTDIIKRIRDFMKDISQLQGFKNTQWLFLLKTN